MNSKKVLLLHHSSETLNKVHNKTISGSWEYERKISCDYFENFPPCKWYPQKYDVHRQEKVLVKVRKWSTVVIVLILIGIENNMYVYNKE